MNLKTYEDFKTEFDENESARIEAMRRYEAPAEAELCGVEMDLLSPLRSPSFEEIIELHSATQAEFQGHTTGWLPLDNIWKIAEGELVVITGIPGHGKSAFVEALTVNMSLSHDWGWVSFSPENWNAAWHFAKAISIYTGKPFLQGPNPQLDDRELARGMLWANKHFTFLRPNEKGSRVDQILHSASFCISHYGRECWTQYRKIKGVVIDPWSQIECRKDRNESEHEYIGKSLTAMANFAKKNKVVVIVVAHPRKIETNNSGANRIPHPYDISGSAHWFNTPDVCITVYREDDGCKIKVWKVKLSERGHVGECKLFFHPICKRFSAVDHVYRLPERMVEDVREEGSNGQGADINSEGSCEAATFTDTEAGEGEGDIGDTEEGASAEIVNGEIPF